MKKIYIFDFIYFASYLNLNNEYATKVVNDRNSFQVNPSLLKNLSQQNILFYKILHK